jgi:hypothetical protein
MLHTRGFALLFGAASIAFAQDKPQLTARELFYAASQSTAAPAPAKTTPAKSVTPAKVIQAPVIQAPRPAHTTPKPVQVAEQHNDAGVKILAVAAQTAPMPSNGQQPLGLRINVLRYNSDGTTMDVLPDTTFHSGDRFRLSVEPNAPGYLYIVNRGASGIWKAMFPSPEIEEGSNRAEAMHPYVIPSGKQVFSFDSTPGKENLFVVFSRQPVPDIEDLIYSLGNKKPASNSEPAPRNDKNLIMAANIGDPTIERLRTAQSRDLIIETVNTTAQGEKRDTAVYVVNASGSPDSRVVADIKLVHQ